ncbi:Pleckstrin y domain-containing family A member 3 [Folsomia candida]|uniref:Pleckstrin y domain-containing family A member 3 n=1 Tax=Folsomia candida TaxID=158441 RepID=A0A226EX66_FOLCA|nr:Pleckstrin y domain-containing family A member 3 [Folsomia candida]
MKGILLKWTNYWNGWQPRWFILEDGILSYYSSEEEVNQGCKGSVCVSACDINVHQTDIHRLDIVIPGEQHIYVRVGSPGERAGWLVALGSAKAQGLVSNIRTRKTSESCSSACSDLAKGKKSELRLYCDLLMQQIHSIKEAANGENGPDKLDESTNLLSATCDTFIKTLDECLTLADANPTYVAGNPVSHLTSANGNLSKGKSKSIVHSNSN